MSLPESSETNLETPVVRDRREHTVAENHTGSGATPIAELAGRPDFPQCALGRQIDIMGFTGTVIEVMKQSIRVRSADGTTQRFNTYRLRQIHGPRVEESRGPEPVESPADTGIIKLRPAGHAPATRESSTVTEPAPLEPESIANPDFTQPLRPISFFAGRSDFPECALGMYVDVAGFSGVVVANIKQSVKVRSAEGELRSFNTSVLRKLYGRR